MTEIIDATPRAIRAPNGLGTAGKALWGRYAAKYELTDTEIVILRSACVMADKAAALEQEMDTRPLVMDGRDHPVINPAVTAWRLMVAEQIKLLGRLDLPADDDGEGGGTYNSQRARRASNARWSRQRQWDGDDG